MTQPVSIPDLLKAGLSARPDADAVVSLEKRWTFRELDEASSRLAASYRNLGLGPGDRIASLMPNRCILLVHYLACMKGGFVAVPLNYRYTQHEISHALQVSGAEAMVHHVERTADIVNCEETEGLGDRIVTVGAEEGTGGLRLEELASGDATQYTTPDIDPDSPACIFFTSGSTGPAKGVTHSFESVAHVFNNGVNCFEMTGEDILLPAASLSHIGAFYVSFAALSVGARVLVARNHLADEILQLMRQERPTKMNMLPAALFTLIRDGHASGEDFQSLRVLRSGADKVPLELEEEVSALTGLEIAEAWGCSEAGVTTTNPPFGRIVAGSIGLPIEGVEISLRDEAGNEVPVGEDGTAWVRTGSIMKGYWGDEGATGNVMRDGWLDTGDLLRADKDGYLWFRGRKKQIIVHDGSNIFPQEVEDALLMHPHIESAGVIGIHDLMHGENVRAYVVMKTDKAAKSEELILFARERVGYKAPEEIVFLEEMPLNPTGKTDRPTLKALAEAHHNVPNTD